MAESPQESELDRATDPEYASVYPLAVIAVVLGLLGFAAFVAALLVAVPVLAIVFALMAMQKIRRSSGVLTGRRLALAGLLLGIATGALGGGYHTWRWVDERATLTELQGRSLQAVDDLLAADRRRAVFDALPEDSPHRRAGFEPFEQAVARLFDGAGNLIDRRLLSLQIVTTETGETLAPADVQVRLERRILDMHVWFRRGKDGRWQLIGIGGEETFQSTARYGPDQSPAPVRGPYRRQ